MTKSKTRTPKFHVVGGRSGKSQWFQQDDGLREFRICLMRNDETSETYFAADYRIAGILLAEHKNQRLPEATTRMEAWQEARSILALLPIPTPPIMEVSV